MIEIIYRIEYKSKVFMYNGEVTFLKDFTYESSNFEDILEKLNKLKNNSNNSEFKIYKLEKTEIKL